MTQVDDETIAGFMAEIRADVKNIRGDIGEIKAQLKDGDRCFDDLKSNVQGVRQTVYGANGDPGLVGDVAKLQDDVQHLTLKAAAIGGAAALLGVIGLNVPGWLK